MDDPMPSVTRANRQCDAALSEIANAIGALKGYSPSSQEARALAADMIRRGHPGHAAGALRIAADKEAAARLVGYGQPEGQAQLDDKCVGRLMMLAARCDALAKREEPETDGD